MKDFETLKKECLQVLAENVIQTESGEWVKTDSVLLAVEKIVSYFIRQEQRHECVDCGCLVNKHVAQCDVCRREL
jgi:lipopolysaccharide biosynthesis regulator YciM